MTTGDDTTKKDRNGKRIMNENFRLDFSRSEMGTASCKFLGRPLQNNIFFSIDLFFS